MCKVLPVNYIVTGGKTIIVRTASGIIKFPWVRNAEEFVNATLAKMEEYKKMVKKDSNSHNSEVTIGIDNSSSADKIKELKSLLDDGIITQQDFDQKKKELLDKM